jgi:hypothetical protein
MEGGVACSMAASKRAFEPELAPGHFGIRDDARDAMCVGLEVLLFTMRIRFVGIRGGS